MQAIPAHIALGSPRRDMISMALETISVSLKYHLPLEEQRSKVELNRARKEDITGENETDEALDRLDQILKEVRENAAKQETE